MPDSLEDMTTDQLLAYARQAGSSHALLQTLMGDPGTREVVQRQLKKLKPTLVIPEIDARDAVEAKLAEERAKREALEAKILEGEVRGRLERERAAAMSKYKLTDADMVEVEKLMVEAKIPVYDSAARVHLASKTPATPTPASIMPPTYSMPEKETWAKGIGNPARLNQIAVEEAFNAWNDIQAGKIAGLGPAVAH